LENPSFWGKFLDEGGKLRGEKEVEIATVSTQVILSTHLAMTLLQFTLTLALSLRGERGKDNN
jgi:hypothetical protein